MKVTGGRDGLVKLWDVRDEGEDIRGSLITRREHTRKVRDVQFNQKEKVGRSGLRGYSKGRYSSRYQPTGL